MFIVLQILIELRAEKLMLFGNCPNFVRLGDSLKAATAQIAPFFSDLLARVIRQEISVNDQIRIVEFRYSVPVPQDLSELGFRRANFPKDIENGFLE